MSDAVLFGKTAGVDKGFGVLVLPSASPKSIRDWVVGLIWANTWRRYNGTMVWQGQALTSSPN
jgi:hypothetical protein